MKEAADFLARAAKEGQRILVLSHQNSDPDAVASVVVLSEVLSQLGANARAGAADDVATIARGLLKVFGREIEVNPSLDVDLVVLVDTSSFQHLGKFGEKVSEAAPRLAVIDHHKPVEETRQVASLHFVREDFASEAELIFELTKELGVNLTPEQASLLLAGIVSDTGHFRLAKPVTFGAVDALLKAGADYERVMEALAPPDDLSKRVAMLKAAGRSKLRRIHGNLVVFSELGSFEGDAAGLLVRIGADVAFVGSEEKGGFRISGRARQEQVKVKGLHLGELMEILGKRFKGAGGGHAGAASMRGEGKLEDVTKELYKALEKILK